MKLTYYGVRGSLPSPGKETEKYGGNTSCIAVEADDTLLILDAGTGIRTLGLELMESEYSMGKGIAHILFSHMHWDHIQGLPFFIPAYVPGNDIHLYCEPRRSMTIEDVVKKQQEPPSFPEGAQFRANLFYHTISEQQPFTIGNIQVTPAALLHPDGVTAYRIDYAGKSIVYATDTEYSQKTENKILDLARDVDLLIYDGQYTPEEYVRKIGWGHSTYEQAANIAEKAGVKQLHLFHHDPAHDDAFIDTIVKNAQMLFPNTHAAREKISIDLVAGVSPGTQSPVMNYET